MENIKTQSKGSEISAELIQAMFETHSNFSQRVNYLVKEHKRINPDIEDCDTIVSIEYQDGFIVVTIAESYQDGFVNSNTFTEFLFALELFSNDKLLDAYIELTERTYNEEKAVKEEKQARKADKKASKLEAKRIKKAKKLLAKLGYAVVAGAPVVNPNENSEQEGSPE
jgi:gamma-glutamylcysteine synthetase